MCRTNCAQTQNNQIRGDLREWFKYFEKMSENDNVGVDLTKKICQIKTITIMNTLCLTKSINFEIYNVCA